MIWRNYLIIFLVFIVAGCNSDKSETGCTPPPEDFVEEDLIGTWRTGIPESNDTIIFREDGTYKQIIHTITRDGVFDYESEWQLWRIEYTEIGIPYIYLEGMRMCVIWGEMSCEIVGGGEGTWYDACRDLDHTTMPPGEGVLMVVGTPKRFIIRPPRGLKLYPFSKSVEFLDSYRLLDE